RCLLRSCFYYFILSILLFCSLFFSCVFFFNDPPTTELYTLSLHDALPISPSLGQALRPSSVPETLSKLARRHRIGRLRPLGNSRSGTTTQSDLRKRAGGWTDWLV